MRGKRIQWYRHARRRESEDDIWRVIEMTVEGVQPRGRPKQRWRDTINLYFRRLDLDGSDAENRVRWRSLGEPGIKHNPATRSGPQ